MANFQSSKSGFQSDTDPFTPPKWLDSVLPAIIIITALLLDLVSAVPYPRPLRSLWRWISSPFRNFLTLDDLLLEPVDRTPENTDGKARVLVRLSGLAFVGWAACLMYSAYMGDGESLVKSLVYSVSWVRNYQYTSMFSALTPAGGMYSAT
jgi:hypothetical protein